MWFDMPPPPPPQIVQTECTQLYSELVHAPSRDVMVANRRAESSGGNGENVNDEFMRQRREAIEEEAHALGAQAGLAWRTKRIEEVLEDPTIRSTANRVFDFNRVMSEQSILLPVISEASEAFEASPDGQQARKSQTTWEIIEPARIVLSPMTWQEYLFLVYEERPTRAPVGLMPYDRSEERMWRQGLCAGFEHGVMQGDLIFQDSLIELVRDYMGMLRFRMLAAQGIVSMPEVYEGRLGVTINGERLHVDDRLIQITAPVRFQDVERWEPSVSLEDPERR